jgi:hypothetical protein
MNFIKDNLSWVVISALLIALILTRSCGPSPPPGEPTIIVKTDTVWKERTITKTEYKLKYIWKDSIVKIPADVDTAAILRDYYSVAVYRDTVELDTIGYVAIEDTVSQNQIISRQTWGSYKVPVITTTRTVILPPELKNKVYGGFSIQAPVMAFGPQLTLVTKRDNMYQLLGGVTTDGPYIGFGMGWKIRLRK